MPALTKVISLVDALDAVDADPTLAALTPTPELRYQGLAAAMPTFMGALRSTEPDDHGERPPAHHAPRPTNASPPRKNANSSTRSRDWPAKSFRRTIPRQVRLCAGLPTPHPKSPASSSSSPT